MAYDKNILKILNEMKDTNQTARMRDYDPKKHYECYVKAKDTFFGDTQIILTTSEAKARKILKAMHDYNDAHKKKGYTYMNFGFVEGMTIPRGKVAYMFDTPHSWWNQN